jgi:hypothetical protein
MALAQADNRKPGQKPPSKAERDVDMPSLYYILHGERHTAAELAFVRRLANSPRLNWRQQVEHVIELSEFESASRRLRSLADELKQRNGGDTEAALLDLLWSVKNSNAR